MTKETQELINLFKQARGKIYYKKNWTQYVFARDKDGNTIDATSPAATCWCALGALQVIADKNRQYSFAELRDTLYDLAHICAVTNVNDANNPNKAHKEVIRIFNQVIKNLTLRLEREEQLFDLAIALAEEQAGEKNV